jgi:hypothetical protein
MLVPEICRHLKPRPLPNLHRGCVPTQSAAGGPRAGLLWSCCQYSIPNGPGPKSGTRHDPKKHGPSPALGTIDSA